MENLKSPDLGALLKAYPYRFRIMRLYQAKLQSDSLQLSVVVTDATCAHGHHFKDLRIICDGPVDYSLRPPNPATLMGGPCLEFHEQHALLDDRRLQYKPGDDGERYNPPLKLKLLSLDQSYVIATHFSSDETSMRISSV